MSGEGPLIGVIGQRTNSSHFLLFDERCLPVAPKYHVVKKIHPLLPKEGWFEQDPSKLVESVWQCLEEVGRRLQAGEVARLKGIGITNQRETTVLWDKTTGLCLHNAIMWCDVRAAEIADSLIAKTPSKNKDHLQSLCGLPIHAYFSALKVRWLMDKCEAVSTAIEEGKCMFGTVDTWIIWNLTGGVNGGVHVTDVTNASRTMLMNIRTLQWDPELCSFFGIPMEILPQIRSSAEVYGCMAKGKFKGIPICGSLGDQQAVLVGQRCFSPGDAKNTYGGGCYLLYNTGEQPVMSHHGMLTTVAYKLGPSKPPAYALEGVISEGESIRWLRDNLELFKDASEIEEIAGHVPDTGGVYFVPEFHAPYWQPGTRRLLEGMTDDTKAHLSRLEGICFQSKEVLDDMKHDSELPLASLHADGGLAVNNLLQLQADFLRIPVVRTDFDEMSVHGAAVAVGIAVQIWKDVSLLPVPSTSTFQPEITSDERDNRYARWKEDVQQSMPRHTV